jgi:hypothetical protein
MASSSENPQPSPATGIQTPSGLPAPAEAPSLPLPPPPQPAPLDAAKVLRQCGWFDAALVVIVLLFAFLVASFPAVNPDFFGQAAIGRMILNGEYRFGVDPFVYSPEETDYFVNHSWLFAVLMYGLYQLPTFGGAIVVIFKALLIAVLAAILIRAGRRPGQSLWIPAASTALAILAVSPRLYLQSTCLSFLFLGVTLWLLTASRQGGKRLWWLLLPLFVLWVNCDAWFFLGPLTLALYLAGDLLQQYLSHSPAAPAGDAPASGVASAPRGSSPLARTDVAGWVVLVIGVAVCLINPHHIHAFTLPPEFGLSPAGDVIENDPQFHSLFLSPLRKDYYQPNLGLNAAGLAYWPLFLLSLASFVFVFGRAPWWRLLVWLGFALMSLYNVRMIPFFAIVAGLIMALNWQDYAAQLLGPAPPLTLGRRNWLLGGRALTVLLGLALLIVAVPGWLQNQPQLRRLGWGVSVNPSLKAMADTIRDWRQSGRLGRDEPNWFNMHYEVANYLAYFAPGERVYLDQNIAQFRKAAEDYEAIRLGLGQADQQAEADGESSGEKKKGFRQILRERHVRYWILDNLIFESTGTQKPELIARALLFYLPKEWVLCHLKGRVAIFAWRDPKQPEAPDPSAGLALDLKRAAFGPEAEPASPDGPKSAPPRNWWESALDVWWPAAPVRSVDADSAALYEIRFLAVEERQEIARHTRAWREGVAAGAVAAALPTGPVPNNLLALNWCWTYQDIFPAGAVDPVRPVRPFEELAMRAWVSYVNGRFFETPSLYLGVRAARRALLVDPEDGPNYFRLGQTYQRLSNLPQERSFRASAPLLAAIRSTQMAGAYQNCLRFPLDDDKAAQAHEALYSLYGQLGYIDATVHHLREALNKRKAAGPQAGMSATQHNQKLEQMADQLNKLDAELERRLNRYDLNAAGKTGLEKVKAALQEGLSETAVSALEQSEGINVNNPTEGALVKQVRGVALDLGRLDMVRQLLPDLGGEPVNPEDLMQYVRLAAAHGDYAEADRLLADALRHAWQPPSGQPPIGDPTLVTAQAIVRVLFAEALHHTAEALFQKRALRIPSPYPGLPSGFWVRRWRLEAVINGLIAAQQQADWHLLRAWLALESGHCVEARQQFQAVRTMAVSGDAWVPEVNQINAWLDPQKEIQGLQQMGIRHSILYALSGYYLNWLVEEQ